MESITIYYLNLLVKRKEKYLYCRNCNNITSNSKKQNPCSNSQVHKANYG